MKKSKLLTLIARDTNSYLVDLQDYPEITIAVYEVNDEQDRIIVALLKECLNNCFIVGRLLFNEEEFEIFNNHLFNSKLNDALIFFNSKMGDLK